METNTIAKIIKVISIIFGVIGAIYGFYAIDGLNADEWGFAIMIISIITAVFMYGFGEVIQLLSDINNNTRKSNNITDNEIPKL